jgi:DMSO/TMAO reductase YedYZ heme-binding membrane subunit
MTILLLYDLKLHAILTAYSGYFTLSFLIIVLCLNRLIKLTKLSVLKNINKYRQQIGVASFSYLLFHLSCFLVKNCIIGDFFNGRWKFFFHPAILPVLFIAFPIMFVLAITSNQYSIRKLSYRKWKKLHRKIYIVEIPIIIHLALAGAYPLALLIVAEMVFRIKVKLKS